MTFSRASLAAEYNRIAHLIKGDTITTCEACGAPAVFSVGRQSFCGECVHYFNPRELELVDVDQYPALVDPRDYCELVQAVTEIARTYREHLYGPIAAYLTDNGRESIAHGLCDYADQYIDRPYDVLDREHTTTLARDLAMDVAQHTGIDLTIDLRAAALELINNNVQAAQAARKGAI